MALLFMIFAWCVLSLLTIPLTIKFIGRPKPLYRIWYVFLMWPFIWFVFIANSILDLDTPKEFSGDRHD